MVAPPIETQHYLSQTGAFVAEPWWKHHAACARAGALLLKACVPPASARSLLPNFAAMHGNSRLATSVVPAYRRAATKRIDAPADEIAHNKDHR
jgi:hypothetical protein